MTEVETENKEEEEETKQSSQPEVIADQLQTQMSQIQESKLGSIDEIDAGNEADTEDAGVIDETKKTSERD
jgi:hypothetical protein